MDYDGEGLLRLTANRTLNLCPDWSPDGSEIAFTSYRDGLMGLYSLDTSNGKVREIIALEGLNYGANWHPDGNEIVLALSRGQSRNLPDHAPGEDRQAPDRLEVHRNRPQLGSRGPGHRF